MATTTTKKKGILTAPDPDDRIVHEMLRKDYPRMLPEDRAKFDRADAAMKKPGAVSATRKTVKRKK